MLIQPRQLFRHLAQPSVEDLCWCASGRDKIATVSTPGRPEFQIYLNKVAAPSLHPGTANKVAIVAVNQDHWFYVNDAFVGHAVIVRQPWARLDMGMVAGVGQQVIGHFQRFRLYTPQV